MLQTFAEFYWDMKYFFVRRKEKRLLVEIRTKSLIQGLQNFHDLTNVL